MQDFAILCAEKNGRPSGVNRNALQASRVFGLNHNDRFVYKSVHCLIFVTYLLVSLSAILQDNDGQSFLVRSKPLSCDLSIPRSAISVDRLMDLDSTLKRVCSDSRAL